MKKVSVLTAVIVIICVMLVLTSCNGLGAAETEYVPSPLKPQLNGETGSAQDMHDGVQTENGSDAKSASYTLHFGLVDDDTGKQKLSAEDAIDVLCTEMLADRTGFTVYKASGVQKDESGETLMYDTIVCSGVLASGADDIGALSERCRVKLNLRAAFCEIYECGIISNDNSAE